MDFEPTWSKMIKVKKGRTITKSQYREHNQFRVYQAVSAITAAVVSFLVIEVGVPLWWAVVGGMYIVGLTLFLMFEEHMKTDGGCHEIPVTWLYQNFLAIVAIVTGVATGTPDILPISVIPGIWCAVFVVGGCSWLCSTGETSTFKKWSKIQGDMK